MNQLARKLDLWAPTLLYFFANCQMVAQINCLVGVVRVEGQQISCTRELTRESQQLKQRRKECCDPSIFVPGQARQRRGGYSAGGD